MQLNDKGKTIFISGATSGLGLNLAQHFVELGFSVSFCGRNQDSLLATEEHLKSFANENQSILGFVADVTDSDSLKRVFLELRNINLQIGVLICNAGVIGPINKFLECDERDWKEAFNINLYGTINLVTEALPSMLENKFGRVIHISGGGATSPLFGMSSYASSKAAAVRFIETLSLEYQDSGVTFNSVAPGILKTKLLDQMIEAGPQKIGENLFTKSVTKSSDIGDSSEKAIKLIEFLSSEDSKGITGKLISAEWDNWISWTGHLEELSSSDLYTLRRITGRERGHSWGDL